MYSPAQQPRNGRRLWRFAPAALWMAVIFSLSARSGGELNTWLPFFRRFLPGLESFDPMHYAAYFILALAVAYGLGSAAWNWRGFLVIMLVCVLYGGTDEWHQAYVPNRTPDWLDLWHDTVGAAAACAVLLSYRVIRRGGRHSRNYRI